MKALVMGGTGFIGRRLVDYLIKDNWDVTIATSGKSHNPFGDAVNTVTFDRFDPVSMEEKLSSPPYFDAIFDQIGFGTEDVKRTIQLFKGRTGRYVFTSSAAVYSGLKGTLSEEDFDSMSYKYQDGSMSGLGYSEGKKSAESYLLQHAEFPVAAARFPNVMGHDDSTTRFQNHVNRVVSGETFNIPGSCGKRNYVWVDDAGRFLMWLATAGKSGPYNAASAGGITAINLVKKMATVLEKEAKINTAEEGEGDSSYFSESDAVLSVSKAEREGFKFTPLDDWLTNETREVAASGGQPLNSMEYFRDLMQKK